jgi:hypothetical protein
MVEFLYCGGALEDYGVGVELEEELGPRGNVVFP